MTREFDTMDEMWTEVIHTCLEQDTQSSRNGATRGVFGWQGKLRHIHWPILTNTRRRMSLDFACAEVLWALSRQANIDFIQQFAPNYNRWSEFDGTAFGAYGHRIANNAVVDQLAAVHSLLENYPDTRQAVIQIWHPNDLLQAVVAGKRDLPCMLHWQFKLVNRELHMHASMRSNDAWLGMPYDVFAYTGIQRILAAQLGVRTGTYTHTVGDLHLYEKYVAAAEVAVSSDAEWNNRLYPQGLDYGLVPDPARLDDQVRWAFSLLEPDRFHSPGTKLNPFIEDCIAVCGHSLAGTDYSPTIHSNYLRETYLANYRGPRLSGKDHTGSSDS